MFLHSILFISLAASAFSMKALPLTMPDIEASGVSNNYIIKIKGDSAKIDSYLKSASEKVSAQTVAGIVSAQGVDSSQVTYGLRKKHEAINGISVTLSEEDMAALKAKHGDEIEYIEPDFRVYPSGYTAGKPWGLERISYRAPAANMTIKRPRGTGKGVTVYVIDSGIKTDHSSFGGRASVAQTFIKTEAGLQDGFGHGTHVAGIIGSTKYGVATEAKVVGLKVFDSQGRGDGSAVIAALDYVTKHAVAGKTVVNLSLISPMTKAMNDAAEAASAAGVVVVVAAGNQGSDSCKVSPASSNSVLSVGATDSKDTAATFSNWGKCVDVYAPGVDIPSLGIKGNDEEALKSGTSMASPYAAGVAAVYLSEKSYKDSKAVIRDVLKWSYRCVKETKGGSGTGIIYANPTLK